MNFQGIKMLRTFGLPGPRAETLQHYFEAVDLEPLYANNPNNATMMVFDITEPVEQSPLLEKSDETTRKYNIPRTEFFDTLDFLVEQMRAKGVADKNIFTVTHHTYGPADIKYSGRVATHIGEDGFGWHIVDAVEGLREGKRDFDPEYSFKVPIVGGRVFFSQAGVIESQFHFPKPYTITMLRDVRRVPGKANIDFHIYHDGRLVYDDMFLG